MNPALGALGLARVVATSMELENADGGLSPRRESRSDLGANPRRQRPNAQKGGRLSKLFSTEASAGARK